jgi:hypothetical protein
MDNASESGLEMIDKPVKVKYRAQEFGKSRFTSCIPLSAAVGTAESTLETFTEKFSVKSRPFPTNIGSSTSLHKK